MYKQLNKCLIYEYLITYINCSLPITLLNYVTFMLDLSPHAWQCLYIS